MGNIIKAGLNNFFAKAAFTLLILIGAVSLKAQDKIVKLSGDTVLCAILEVNVETVSFKKASMVNGATFTIRKNEIASILFSNGSREDFNTMSETKREIKKDTLKSTGEKKKKIEKIHDNFFVNNHNVSKKEVDNMLAHSRNPAVVVLAKSTRSLSTFQKIMKITSYPTTIAGSALSIFTWAEGYQLVQRGRATRKTFLNMGLSLVGTLTFPLTSHFMKKKNDKMYDKVIEMYNVTN